MSARAHHSMNTRPEDDKGVTRAGDHVAINESHTVPSPALQVICLGSGGGPSEDNVTGFLVRSIASGWSRGSILAVDAGSHLAAITRMLENAFPLYSDVSDEHGSDSTASALSPAVGATEKRSPTVLKSGPFAGLSFPNASARANALHVLHSYISTYLISHPHLDHLSGFAINTAALSGRSRPKTLAALPATVDAVKQHIFNDVIWPNLSDEDGGVGFVTFQRLKHGGDSMIGEGDARGYIDVVEGIGVKAFSVSHGVCTSHQLRGSIPSAADFTAAYNINVNADHNGGVPSRATSVHDHASGLGTPGQRRQSVHNALAQPQYSPTRASCIVDSTAFFIRDEETAREVLIFGDIEPDSVSMFPRNEQVWQEAAPRIINGNLRTIMIECSYTDAVSDETLFGHLCPRHLIAELQRLAEIVHEMKLEGLDVASRKRKRSRHSSVGSPMPSEISVGAKRTRNSNTSIHSEAHRGSIHDHDAIRSDIGHSSGISQHDAISPRAIVARGVSAVPHYTLPSQTFPRHRPSWSTTSTWDEPPLVALTVIVIHVKDTFRDGPPVSETILAQLKQHAEALKGSGCPLGCTFVISKAGESYWV